MALNRNELFKDLLNNFLDINLEVEAVIVSDYEGFVIAGEKRKDIDIEIISILTTIVNPILERIRNEFAFNKFGSGSFDTDNNRLIFISVDEKTILTLVLNNMASIDKISPYGFFLAEKTIQILMAKEDDKIQVSVPNFEYEAEQHERLKNQIYQMRLDSGGIYRFKFIIIGEHEVGKTSIVRRFVENKFAKDYRATIGINIITHSFHLFKNEITFSLWDIGAQQYFKRFRKTYYLGAQAAFIVFDLTNKKSFNNVRIWHTELEEFLGKKDLPIIIVGNKTDLIDQRQVKYQDGVRLTNELSESDISQLSYIETSALTGENIEDAFSLISYHYIMKSKEREEMALQKDLFNQINSIVEDRGFLTLTSIIKNPFWNPVLQILSETNNLRKKEKNEKFLTKIKDEEKIKIYQYSNGLILKSFLYDFIDVSDSDGVFCLFDARGRDHINPKWKEILAIIIDQVEENKVVLVGIRISENIDWSKLMEEFDVNEQLEKKMVSLLFCKIGIEYIFEIYDHLDVMLNSIKNIH